MGCIPQNAPHCHASTDMAGPVTVTALNAEANRICAWLHPPASAS